MFYQEPVKHICLPDIHFRKNQEHTSHLPVSGTSPEFVKTEKEVVITEAGILPTEQIYIKD